MNSSGAKVEIRNVSKSFGPAAVVGDVSFVIEPGEFVSLLGPSGSGKTTTLMMIAGFETPDKGSILIGDEVVDNVPPQKRGLGFVFQNYALFPHLTVSQNVAYSLEIRGEAKDEIARKVSEILELVDLPQHTYGDRRAAQLSGGQQQRVALARALVFRPRVLLLDEPLGALDRNLRRVMLSELRRIHRKLRTTIIYVTHDQDEALTMSDRIAVFSHGRIQQIGSPTELYYQPVNDEVAKFLGDSTLIPVTATEDSGRWATDQGLVVPGRMSVSTDGSKTALVIRPESLSVTTPEAGILVGVVREVVYVGDHVEITVDTPVGEVVAKVYGRQSIDEAPLVDQIVGISWDKDDGATVSVGQS